MFVVFGYKCKVIHKMSALNGNLLECLTIEKEVEKAKNLIISFIYRILGSYIDHFNTNISEILDSFIRSMIHLFLL